MPAATPVPAWPQSGGTTTHALGNIAVTGLRPAWSAGIGEGGGYRAKLTAQPIVPSGSVYTMDSDGQVASFDLASGRRRWRTDTQGEKDRSTNIGGGIAIENGTVYAATGRAEALALEAATGRILLAQGHRRAGPVRAHARRRPAAFHHARRPVAGA